MRRGGRLFAGLIALALAATPQPALAQASENAVKAAFLPRFARYVTWPPAARPSGTDPFLLCIIGDDPFGKSLDQAVKDQSVDGRRIAVKRLASAEGAGGCHIAFVESSRGEPPGQILAALAGKPVLTVTDARNGSHRGVIHFAIVRGRVKFFIDAVQAAKNDLSISSRLLALAIGVRSR